MPPAGSTDPNPSPGGVGGGLGSGPRAAALVSQMAVSALLGTWIGWKLDARFGSEPWGLVIGSVIGFALGLFTLFRGLHLSQSPAQEETAPDDDPPSHPPQ